MLRDHVPTITSCAELPNIVSGRGRNPRLLHLVSVHVNILCPNLYASCRTCVLVPVLVPWPSTLTLNCYRIQILGITGVSDDITKSNSKDIDSTKD